MKKKIIKLNESDIENLVGKIIKEDNSTEDNFLSMLVESVIKEEEGEEETGNETSMKDNPKDVEKFLDLADKYLFKKFGKFAEKINTRKEKAMLIASLAKRWGVEPEQLGKVKSLLNTENMSPEEAIITEWNPFKKKGGYDKSVDGNRTYTQDELFDYMKKKYGISNRDISVNMSRNVFQIRLKGMIQYNIHGERSGDNVRLSKAASELHNMMIKESTIKRKPINEVNINNTVKKVKASGRIEDYEIETIQTYVRNKVGGTIENDTIYGDGFTISLGNRGFTVNKDGGLKTSFNVDQIGRMAKFLKESKLDEAGGYDDDRIMSHHAGIVMSNLKKVFLGVNMGISGLLNVIKSGEQDKFDMIDNLKEMVDLLDEGITITNNAINDFTEDDLIAEAKGFISTLKRFTKRSLILINMGDSYSQEDLFSEVVKLATDMKPVMEAYAHKLVSKDEMFTNRFSGADRGRYTGSDDYLN